MHLDPKGNKKIFYHFQIFLKDNADSVEHLTSQRVLVIDIYIYIYIYIYIFFIKK
jgi:hypothetical protein